MSELKRPRARGQSLVEFSLVSFMLCAVFLAVAEMSRMILVAAAVANAARAGERYAMVHGSSRGTGTGSQYASGPSNNPAPVLTVINDFARAGALTTSRLAITVTYPGASNAPGQLVDISVVYPYDPLTSYIPFSVRLGSNTEGVIEY